MASKNVKGIPGGSFSTSNGPIPNTPHSIPGAPGKVPSLGGFGAPKGVHLRDVQGRFVKGGFGFEWEGLGAVLDLPDTFGTIIQGNIERGMSRIAASMEIYAKENAPWEDRTGDARRGLKAITIFDQGSGRYEIDLGHSVSYGYYLENANGGAFAIVLPTVRLFEALLPATIKG